MRSLTASRLLWFLISTLLEEDFYTVFAQAARRLYRQGVLGRMSVERERHLHLAGHRHPLQNHTQQGDCLALATGFVPAHHKWDCILLLLAGDQIGSPGSASGPSEGGDSSAAEAMTESANAELDNVLENSADIEQCVCSPIAADAMICIAIFLAAVAMHNADVKTFFMHRDAAEGQLNAEGLNIPRADQAVSTSSEPRVRLYTQSCRLEMYCAQHTWMALSRSASPTAIPTPYKFR